MNNMTNWEKVNSIKNPSITVDAGQDSSTIYGNGRNCAAVTVSFNGMNDKLEDPYVDLSKENIGPFTYLVDFDTGKELAWEKLADDETGLFYSFTQGNYCNWPDSTDAPAAQGNLASQRRAYVTFYLYGKGMIDTKRMVAFKVKFGNSKEESTTRVDDDHRKVDILIKSQISYNASNLEPINWVPIYRPRNDIFQQYVAFVKLKREFKTNWIIAEFQGFNSHSDKLTFVSRTVRMVDGHRGHHVFFLCPLGRQDTVKVQSFGIPWVFPDKEIDDIQLSYNQEPNALCLVYIRARVVKSVDEERFMDGEGFFKLYDTHGNLGEFKLDFADAIKPTVVTQNF